ncbi:MAG: NUDIX domain-containing protein [Proteobacteria bacterium]|nr:NUDIX domain-containing protein [Pseudomonadota bacterium]
MARKQSAGLLLFRWTDRPGQTPECRAGTVEVLLVHPSGSYNRGAPWSIPKGLVESGEDLATAARRETREETGLDATEIVSLGAVDYRKSRKRVHAFGAHAPPDATPRCASWEVDRAEFVPLERARELIHPDQAPFLDRLCAHLAKR